jgi:hypothetical protein
MLAVTSDCGIDFFGILKVAVTSTTLFKTGTPEKTMVALAGNPGGWD